MNSTYKKITAVVLTVVLAACLTACSGGAKDPEKEKEKRKPSGYRCYLIEDPQKPDDRVLVSEYEDLVTEVTYKTYSSYDDHELESVTRWYYDENGEYLLKRVDWSASDSMVTTSTEYDTKGRKIRYSEKQEHESTADQEKPKIALEYVKYLPSATDYYYYNAGNDVKELVTEFTYKGDSDKLASMRTVTDSGKEVATVELGDGDIVLFRKFETLIWRLEERYDPDKRTGVWYYYNRDYPDPENTESEEEWERYSYGPNEYDESGRIVRSQMYLFDYYSTIPYLSEEIVYSYETDGTVTKTTKNYDALGQDVGAEGTEKLDSEGRVLYDLDIVYNSDGSLAFKAERTYTYHDNGVTASQLERRYNESQKEMCTVIDDEFDEGGNTIASRSYDSAGNLTEEFTTVDVKTTDIAGKTRCRIWTAYDREIDYKTYEVYDIQMSMPCGFEDWIRTPYGTSEWYVYRTVTTDWYGDATANDYNAKFDADGHLLKVDTNLGLTYVEFDTQGRIIHCFEGGNCEWEYEYEYWEGEAPQK